MRNRSAEKTNPSAMDEPTSALDPIATESIEEPIAELREDFTAVIVMSPSD